MAGWTDYFNYGDRVQTPHGIGVVQRMKENGEVRVKVDGQLFDVPKDKVHAARPGGGGDAPKAEGEKKPKRQLNRYNIKKGDRVQNVQNPASKGEVTEVTQRTVRVKWDANGKVRPVPKDQVAKHLEFEDQEDKQEGKQEEKPEQKPREERNQDEQARDTADDLYGLFNLKDKLEKKIDDEVDGELKDLREAVKKSRKLEVKVGDKTHVIEGLKHKQLEQLITYSALRLSPLLVGMAGTGKSHAGEQVAEALGLQFYAMSVGAQTSKSDIIGYNDASGNYVRTHFRDAYEFGGVFLMDEIDAGNANVLIQVNAALSNGLCAFPDAMVKRHEDFIFIASANTYGNGADRQYVGRNQLDAATLDRFAVIDWLIDDDLEESLAVGLNGKAWYMSVRAARDYVAEKKIRALISPRATQKGSQLLNAGQDLKEVIDATMLASVPQDKRQDVTDVATKIFEKFASDVPKQLPEGVEPPTAEDLVKIDF